MSDRWVVRVFDGRVALFDGTCDGPLEIGRQFEAAEPLFTISDRRGRPRLAVAGRDDDSISRGQALLSPLPDGRVKVENQSNKVPMVLHDGRSIDPRDTCDVALPFTLTLGRKLVQVVTPEAARAGDDDVGMQSLGEVTHAPSAMRTFLGPRPSTLRLQRTDRLDAESTIRRLQAVMEVLQAAAGSWDFFVSAAKALVEIIGLDNGFVLLRHGDDWRPEAVHSATGEADAKSWMPSRGVLDRVARDRRTYWRNPADGQTVGSTLGMLGVRSIAAAPILDENDRVMGVVYGDRAPDLSDGDAPPISKTDAMFVELIAVGVATGLARLRHEQAALAMQVRFEQFFTPELAEELARQPELLAGQDREISVLFCDIRGFSRVSERLGPSGTVEWINDVMGTLSDCVLEHEGVLVDYIGDELMAMWGAPREQPDHAERACRAALAMLAQLPSLEERWRSRLGEVMGLGIGVNTGIARVGNTGSKHKFKYGPLGNTVNVASRVQGATKYFKTRVLVTKGTREKLSEEIVVRRVGRVRLMGIPEPVDLFELPPADQPGRHALREAYEGALEDFENGRFRRAARALGNLVTEYPGDGPSLVLISRAASLLLEEPTEFDPAFTLPGK